MSALDIADSTPAGTGIRPLDMEAIRSDFPILDQEIHGHRLTYLDSAASSQRPTAVIRAIAEHYTRDHANVHRGAHELSVRSTRAYEEARVRMARFMGAPRSEEVVFTRSTTESVNLVAYAWGRANLSAGDTIVVTEMEHHSNLVPWHIAAEMTGAGIAAVRVTDDGELDLDHLSVLLSEHDVRLVATGHVSNATGTIHPVAEIARQAHEAGALYLIDGAQAAPHLPVDVASIGCDFYTVSGHKMCGPTGSGVLWGRREILDAMPPFLGGGHMIESVEIDHSTYARTPQKYEAGTPAIASAIGLGAAVEYLERIGMKNIHAHEARIARVALERLADEFPKIELHGPPAATPRAAVISFTLGDVHPHDLATILDHHGVAIRAGHHCCQPLMKRLGVTATARASFYLYNDEEDLEALVVGLREAARLFGI